MTFGCLKATSPLLALIDTVLVPSLARKLVGSDNVQKAVVLMFIARFVVLLVVPVVTAILLGTDCYGLWIKLWEPCQLSNSFEMSYYTSSQVTGGVTFLGYSTPFTTHDEICAAQPPAPGRCSRFVIESLGDLLVSKLLFTAFVSPAVTLLRNLPWAVRVQEVVMRVLMQKEGYAPTMSLDMELVLLAMMLDEVLVVGLAVPAIAPLACVAVLVRLAVLQLTTKRLGMEVVNKEYATPLCHNFIVSLMLGAAFNLWFFVDNTNQNDGAYIACIGLPLGIAVGIVGGLFWNVKAARRQHN